MKEQPVVINTSQEAVALLQQLLDPNLADADLPDDVEISGELATLLIEVEGKNFHSSITGTLARGLWETQQELYRSVALTIHGAGTIKKLSKEELRDYNLVINVDDGCAKLWVCLKDFLGHLSEGINTMESRHRLVLYIVAPLIVVTGMGLTWVKLEDIEAGRENARDKEYTARMEIVRQAAQQVPGVERWVEASKSSARSIAKSVPDATALTIGAETVDAVQISEINQRAAREIPDVYTVTGYFRVLSTTKPTPNGISRIGLSGNGREFIALINLKGKDPIITDEQSNLIFLAPKTGDRIYMQVRLKETSDGIKEASIRGFPADSDPG